MPTELDSLDDLRNVYAEISQDFNTLSFKPVFEQFVQVLEDVHANYFDSRRGPSGMVWEDWHWRTPWGPTDHPTLEVSKRLRGSLRSGGADNIQLIEDRQLTFGTSVAYAGIHNFGATFALGVPLVSRDGGGYLPIGTVITIPQREFVGIDKETTQQFLDLVADFTVASLKE